jgi:hypothetical protein
MRGDKRRNASIPRSEDPLGLGRKSIPEPLQRYWLVREGNPYFEAEVLKARDHLGIPSNGFEDAPIYIEWLLERPALHGHPATKPGRYRTLINSFNDLTWPIGRGETPSPCCNQDPLRLTSGELAHRYGLLDAELEPGFEHIVGDILMYMVAGIWLDRKSEGKVETEYESALYDPSIGQIRHEKTTEIRGVIKSGGGAGGQLPVYFEWWKLDLDGNSVEDIVVWTEEQYATEIEYDQRSIRHGIKVVEGLMSPEKN